MRKLLRLRDHIRSVCPALGLAVRPEDVSATKTDSAPTLLAVPENDGSLSLFSNEYTGVVRLFDVVPSESGLINLEASALLWLARHDEDRGGLNLSVRYDDWGESIDIYVSAGFRERYRYEESEAGIFEVEGKQWTLAHERTS